MTTFTLTTQVDNIIGDATNDVFKGTYNDGATGTWGNLDAINGGDGIDTLNISPIGVAAITPADDYWQHITNVEKIVINSTKAGVQTITTGVAFEGAFAASGISFATSSGAGAITVDMASFTGVTALNTKSIAGAQTITTGSGVTNVTASSDAGALTIKGVGLVTARASTTSGGAQTIGDALGGGDMLLTVIAKSNDGAQTITSTNSANVRVEAFSTAGVQTISTGSVPML